MGGFSSDLYSEAPAASRKPSPPAASALAFGMDMA
jgi:hypothetical protein